MENNSSLHISQLPFFWRYANPDDRKSVVPDVFLPFHAAYNFDLKLIYQIPNARTEKNLEAAYKQNVNLGYLQEGHSLAALYGDDFFEFICRALPSSSVFGGKILEVGCGGCYNLGKLKQAGYEVFGIDPSPVAASAGVKLDINIIQEFYPKGVVGKNGVIIHYNVLEHMADPLTFLHHNLSNLDEGGLMFTGVPDCTRSISNGDISMFIHEHYNYFDEHSLATTVEKAGFKVLKVEKSQKAGVLYCAAIKEERAVLKANEGIDENNFLNFLEKSNQIIEDLKSRILDIRQSSERTFGFYVPLRALPYLALIDLGVEYRFFDDDPGIHGKFIDGHQVPIENFSDLCETPITDIFVMSFEFGDKIAHKIGQVLPNTTIVTLADLGSEGS